MWVFLCAVRCVCYAVLCRVCALTSRPTIKFWPKISSFKIFRRVCVNRKINCFLFVVTERAISYHLHDCNIRIIVHVVNDFVVYDLFLYFWYLNFFGCVSASDARDLLSEYLHLKRPFNYSNMKNCHLKLLQLDVARNNFGWKLMRPEISHNIALYGMERRNKLAERNELEMLFLLKILFFP